MRRPILVTGGSGFIGRHLVSKLRSQGQHVRVLVRRPDTARELEALGAEAVVGDVVDRAIVQRAVADVRGVFHLAGRLFTPGVPPRVYARLHVDATATLVEACAVVDRLDFFVLCSTTGVHGPTGSQAAREDDPGCPENAYEVTKAQGERTATEIARRTGVPLVIARPGLVYGPGDLHLLGWFRAIRDGYYRVIGPGSNLYHPIYVADLVRALCLCADVPNPDSRAYHLVGPRTVSVRDLSDAIGHAIGRKVARMHIPAWAGFAVAASMEALLPVPRALLPLTRSRVRFLLQSRIYDNTRAREDLGFIPEVDLREGLSRTVAWYRSHGLL